MKKPIYGIGAGLSHNGSAVCYSKMVVYVVAIEKEPLTRINMMEVMYFGYAILFNFSYRILS